MTPQAAKILSEYHALSREERAEVFAAIVSEPCTAERRAKLERQSFFVRSTEELRQAVAHGVRQADEGDFTEFTADTVKSERRRSLEAGRD